MHLVFIAIIGSIFILLLVIVKLLLFGGDKRYLNLLLSTAIIGVIWYDFVYLLTNSGLVAQYPVLFNKGLPLYYLIAPCFFLYIRGSLNSTKATFKKSHLWHFLIVIPAVISIIPYNLADAATQQWVVNQVQKNVSFAFSDNKYIVSSLHWFAFPLSALFYSAIQLRMAILAARKRLVEKAKTNWIIAFTIICCIIFLGMIAVNLTVLANFDEAWNILKSGKLVSALVVCLLLLSGSFFVNPTLIFGFVPEKAVNPPVAGEIAPAQVKPDSDFQAIGAKMYNDAQVEKVETFMAETQIYRKTGLTVSDLASMLDIPNHKLSDLFNNHYKLNFNTFINNLRVQYVRERLEGGEWKRFTLEAIAQDAGFSSRNTFAVAFKKTTGVTPSNYITILQNKTD